VRDETSNPRPQPMDVPSVREDFTHLAAKRLVGGTHRVWAYVRMLPGATPGSAGNFAPAAAVQVSPNSQAATPSCPVFNGF
jgi:hypothetical protein